MDFLTLLMIFGIWLIPTTIAIACAISMRKWKYNAAIKVLSYSKSVKPTNSGWPTYPLDERQ